jgi:hypothetical protein
MTIAKYYLNATSFARIPEAIGRFPEVIRPTHFGQSEERHDPRFPLSRAGAKEALEQLTHSGYLLFGDDVVDTLSPPVDGHGELFVSSGEGGVPADELKNLTHTLAELGFEFGFIAEWEEYLHRNQHKCRLQNGKIQSWVGRNLSKYLPGLYWISVLRTGLAKKFGIGDDRWPPSTKILDFGPMYLALQLFDQPSNWAEYAREIDALCAQNENIFSIEEIRQQLETAKNYVDLTRLLRNWP